MSRRGLRSLLICLAVCVSVYAAVAVWLWGTT